MSNKEKNKVWNVVGSFFGDSSLLPEGSVLQKLEVVENQSKLDYYSGEVYSPEATRFRATFLTPDGETRVLDINSKLVQPDFDANEPFINNNPDPTAEAVKKTLSFSYTYEDVTKSDTLTINVWSTKFTFSRIEITTPPNKTIYYSGERFDNTGMVVTAYSEEGNSRIINACEPHTSCSPGRNCYWWNDSPLVGNESESVQIEFTYCIPTDFENPAERTAKFYLPITVYQEEKKAILKVELEDKVAVKEYYSGTTFNSQGIKVYAKYPRDPDFPEKPVESELLDISVEEYPSGVVYYTDENQGKLTLKIVYNDPNTKKQTISLVEDVISAYEIDFVWNNFGSGDTFYVGDKLSKSDFPMQFVFKPSTKPPEQYHDYNWVANEWIDSNGKLLKATNSSISQKTEIKISKVYEHDPQKITRTAVIAIEVFKKKIPVSPPKGKYEADIYQNSVQALKLINITSSEANNTFKKGIGVVTVNGVREYDATRYFTPSADGYQWQVQVNLITDDNEKQYIWENTKTTETRTCNIKLRRVITETGKVSLDPSSISLKAPSVGSPSTGSVTVSLGTSYPPIEFSRDITKGSLYCNAWFTQENNSDYNKLQIEALDNDLPTGTQQATIKINADGDNIDDGWRLVKRNYTSSNITVNVTYRDPWSWTSSSYNTASKCSKWWQGFAENASTTSLSSKPNVRVYYSSGSYQTFEAVTYTGGYMYFLSTSSIAQDTFSDITNSAYPNQYSSGQTNPQLEAKTIINGAASYCSGWYNAVDNRTQTYPVKRGDNSSTTTCSGTNSARLWLPSYEELTDRTNVPNGMASVYQCTTVSTDSSRYRGTDKDSVGVFESVCPSGRVWVRNGSYHTNATTSQRVASWYYDSYYNGSSTGTSSWFGRVNVLDSTTCQIWLGFRIRMR